ncbi:MAG: Tn3 family transposase, partial [Myxococcales bacterium]|nr:Tn3 family transposase [Myxococcales bacterium]
VAFGRRGRLTRKDAEGLLNQAACLNLVSNAVVAWNTVYLDRVVQALRAEGVRVRDEDVARRSPARHQHVHVLGKHRFDDVPDPGRLRQLRGPA